MGNIKNNKKLEKAAKKIEKIIKKVEKKKKDEKKPETKEKKEESDDKSDLNSQLEQMVDKEKSNSQIENNEQTKELEKLETHKGEVKPHEHHSSKHNKDDDYYHVDATKITLFVYNYSTGFVQALKEPKFKISKVVDQINKEKEKLSNLNSKFIANPKLAKEKKRNAISTKQIMDDDELDAYSKKKIKLKEIQKALASKEKQSAIVNLCLFSFIIFFLVIGSSVTSLLVNIYIRDQI